MSSVPTETLCSMALVRSHSAAFLRNSGMEDVRTRETHSSASTYLSQLPLVVCVLWIWVYIWRPRIKYPNMAKQGA
jgi:hypothetical protein